MGKVVASESRGISDPVSGLANSDAPFCCARTYPQLINQLRTKGFANSDLYIVRDAYELAMVLFTGRYQPSGKSFIAHGVGTASILATLPLPAHAVVAGLIHNVYTAGDFGDGAQGVTAKRRRVIRRTLGPEVDACVARFPDSSLSAARRLLSVYERRNIDGLDYEVLSILMADHLEHLYDLDLLYYTPKVRQIYLDNCRLAAEVADEFGLASLASELLEHLQRTESAELPVQLPKNRMYDQAFVITPQSRRKRLTVRMNQQCRVIYRSIRKQARPCHRIAQALTASLRERFSTINWAARTTFFNRMSIRDAPASLFEKDASVQRMATGFEFTEGPVWIAEAESLLFSDIPANQIFGIRRDGAIDIFRQPSGTSNGLTRDKQGRLISCEQGNRRVTRTEKDGSITVVAAEFEGKKLNSPNDVIVKSDGAIYFTDPAYGVSSLQREQSFESVYRISPDGRHIVAVATDFKRPNGLAFSPDEKTLYVDDSSRRHIRAFNVQEDGSLGENFIFHDMNVKIPGSPDGIKVDVEGRVYCAGAGGVWVFDAEGSHLGTIATPEKPSNCAWGGHDWRSLFITAGSSVYKIKLRTTGIRVP